ncbi:MAG: DUF1592 domain-containing protein [Gemmatimonadetes bacterium]|nr:DUF1592 domain-containing protein [Gemmatimonadota bacterium]
MKTLTAAGAGTAVVLALATPYLGGSLAEQPAAIIATPMLQAGPSDASPVHRPVSGHLRSMVETAGGPSLEDLTAVIRQYCMVCHNDALLTGNLTLQNFDVARAVEMAETAEKVVGKLRNQMMPPPEMPRPGGDTLMVLATTLESLLDEAAAAEPNPGGRTFQRLNRAEYTSAVRDLLGLEVDAGIWLPLDTKSDNFDNIADVQVLSPTLLDAYLRAGSSVSWLAIGNPRATSTETAYTVPRTASQTQHVEGAPYGTRGGISAMHNFPADGEYVFRLSFYHETTGAFVGGNARGEQLEISVDGERVALLPIDRFMQSSDPNGVTMYTGPVTLRAGPHRVSAAFIPPEFQASVQDLISPLKWSLASTSNATAYGFSVLPHVREMVIIGPSRPTGVSDNPVRERIFTCRPARTADDRACAATIIEDLATRAFRRPLTPTDRTDLNGFYERGSAQGGFEAGVRLALEAILASPDYVFRLERSPGGTAHDGTYPIRDIDLATRLAFFLWSAPPDDELRVLAEKQQLSRPDQLERQVRRMLRDPRSEALATRFASQWLRLQDLDKVNPDVRQYPDFDEQLRAAMRRETELFFDHIVREDRSVLELFTADYSFVNERLADHYGIRGVSGPAFRKVAVTDENRRGVFGHASLLTLTSHAGRTSPVDRGKWVMEVFLHSPPPPPPPGVPDLEATPGVADGRTLTVRERMEQHRSNPMCQSCHRMMDPIGLALENYDVTGRWRVRDGGMPIDSRGQLWDGTPVESPSDLRAALLRRPEPLVRTFARNLMAYAIGRRVEYFDMPTIRALTRESAKQDHRISSYILGVVNSPAFRMQRVEPVAETGSRH